MSPLILSASLVGGLFGLRFKVLILIPAIGLVSVAALVTGIARGDGAPAVLMAATLAGACVQIGYLCGAAIRYALTPMRTEHPRKASLPAASAR